MKICTKTLLTALTTCTLVVGSAGAANVIFVDSDSGLKASWQTLIESGGHTFTHYSPGAGQNYDPDTAGEISYFESFDVIVMSGSNANFNSVRAHGNAWESLSTPTLNLGNYLLAGNFSASSWQWTTPTTGGAGSTNGALDVLVPSDLLFTGVTLNPGSPETTNDLFYGTAGTLTLGSDSLLPGITLIATEAGNADDVVIARAAAGTLQAGGGEHIFLAGQTGGNGQDEPYNAAGEQVFLNAIGVLSGELVPEPGTLALLGLGGLLVARRRRD